jgi:hypothetical protein
MTETPDLVEFFEEVRTTLREVLPEKEADTLFALGERWEEPSRRAQFYRDVLADTLAAVEGGETSHLSRRMHFKHEPVSMETFVCSPDYLDKAAEIYPKVLEELIEINSGKYVEAVFTGGIGSAKTTAALYTTAYQLYLLSCLESPHKVYGLDPASEILFVFQSINAKVSKASFSRFKSMIETSPYFRKEFPFDPRIESKLVFPHRIEVVPVSGKETAAIGQNVMGGMIDELNYMEVVDKSKQSVDGTIYDQAVALYNSIARRRKSRFMQGGRMPGILCLVSSKRYPGQFTDLKEEEAKKDPTIYIYDYRVWEIKPEGSFTGEMFDVFIGDMSRKPRVLVAGDEVAYEDRPLVKSIPEEYRVDFDKDIVNALREIAGVSTLARFPFMIDVEKVSGAFGKHESIFSRDVVDFVDTGLEFYPERFWKPQLPRFVHIDLAISGDSAGFAVGCVPGFQRMQEEGYSSTGMEMAPRFRIDGLLAIKPPRGGEILLWKIRDIVTKLREAGLNIRWVTFDQFQSKDSQQLLRQQGLLVGQQSVDITAGPYETLKNAFYTSRMAAPSHVLCQRELLSLERDPKKGTIDHPPTGSKDVSDALAGVVHGLTMRREVWNMFSVPVSAFPAALRHDAPEDKKLTGPERLVLGTTALPTPRRLAAGE